MSPLDRELRFTLFNSVKEPKGKRKRVSFRDLADIIATVDAPQKASLPLLEFGLFNGNYRNDENLFVCDAVFADYDGEEITMGDAARLLRKAGLAAILYSSPRHTADKPRWRVGAVLRLPCEPASRAAFVARLNGVLGGVLAGESFTPSQCYYFGGVGGKPPKVLLIDGDYIDDRDDLDAGAIGKSETPRERAKPKDGVDRSAVLFALACEYRRGGKTFEQFELAWRANRIAADFVKFDKAGRVRSEKMQRRQVERAWDRAESADADAGSMIEQMNQRYATVRLSGGTCIAEFKRDGVDFGTIGALHAWHENQRVPSGNTTVPQSMVWIRSPERRQYSDGVVFDPTGESPAGALNLWRGWGVQPNPDASCDLILKHIREVISAGDETLFDYNIKYDAHMVQRPGDKPCVARVLRGPKGAGKDTYGELLARIVGARHAAIIGDSDRLTARFNSAFESALLAHVEEAFFSGDPRARGKLQHIISAPAITVERKGIEPFKVRSFLRILMTTNEKWAVPASADERRYFVADVSGCYMQNTTYFAALRAEIEGDGAGAYLHYLMGVDLTGFDVRAVPQTQALAEQKIASLDSIGRWWESVLEEGRYWGDAGATKAVKKDLLYDDYERYALARRYGGNPKDRREFFKVMKRILPASAVETRGARERFDGGEGARFRMVRLPPLAACERAFARYAGVAPKRGVKDLLA